MLSLKTPANFSHTQKRIQKRGIRNVQGGAIPRVIERQLREAATTATFMDIQYIPT